MLVLSRNLDEAIRIGDDVRVKVVGVRGNRVKLAIDAPQSVVVLRDELEPRRPAAKAEGGDRLPSVARRKA
jgi:carbon storage regulator CsrA